MDIMFTDKVRELNQVRDKFPTRLSLIGVKSTNWGNKLHCSCDLLFQGPGTRAVTSWNMA